MPKSKTEPLEDGWTRVSCKKGAPQVSIFGLPPLAKDITLDKLILDFTSKMKIWQRSSSRKEVYKMLDRQQPDDGWSFNKAVCLASGSFSRDNWECSKRSMFQFVAFVDIVRRLCEMSSTSISMLAQDPSYTDLDKTFLSQLDFNVLDISWDEVKDLGRAKDHLGPQTLVFELYMDMGLESLRDLLDSDMHLYVGSSMQAWILASKSGADQRRKEYKGTGFTEPSGMNQTKTDQLQSDLAREFQKNHRSLHFPRFEEDPLIFEGLMFHWKEPTDDEDEDG